ncbi:DUF541 domain-containing protein [Sphingomonas ginkgonis]|uniref:DUF541 domain-containing protein n=1 Tax=Sphingomonas ginkgonis TaxID=2315330 RepID=A0A3R9Z780_9SPHN|nr:SIMPL domain-containing protein [Sphingomonas ginkgonis]RST31516.1 DUF541 domain-containing protein [Sphingomonas ginkgonis]
MIVRVLAGGLLAAVAVPAAAQIAATPDQLAGGPVVTVQISEQLRSPPDQATISMSTESRAPTATAALAANKGKTQALLVAIRKAGIGDKDVQTEGISLGADYRFEQVNGVGSQRFIGYVARNTVRIKTRELDRLSGLLDTLTAAGATGIYGPSFDIANPLPIRSEARRRAMVRGEAEAGEYARNAGFARVRLLTVQEGVSYRSDDIIVTGSRVPAAAPPPPPPPPAPERDGAIAPGQIETGVTLTLQYRMER